MSANRIVYAEGSRKPCFSSVGSSGSTVSPVLAVVGSDMSISWGDDGQLRRDGLVLPRMFGLRHLEADEPVDDVEHGAEQVEEAERKVSGGGDAEHSRDVGTAGVPGHQH